VCGAKKKVRVHLFCDFIGFPGRFAHSGRVARWQAA